MRLSKFEYLEPKSVKEAVKSLSADPAGTFLLAGGTDLLPNMKYGVIKPRQVINLRSIPKLSYLTDEKEGLRIGALTTLHDLVSSSVVSKNYPALARAAGEVAAYALQVMGTIGGNLCQGNRCRFFNQSSFWRGARPLCLKAGGEICHVVPGRSSGGAKHGECYSTYCGDLAPVLIAMDAKVKVMGPNGDRIFPLKRLYTQRGNKPLSLRKGEILKEIFIPAPSGKTLYLKWRLRNSLEFPIVSLALHIEKDKEGKVSRSKIIFSGVGCGPVQASGAEKLLTGASLDDPVMDQVSGQAVKEISPMRTSIHSPAYKRKMAGILLRQALEKFQAPNPKSQTISNSQNPKF